MNTSFWSLGGEKLHRETIEGYSLSGLEANPKSSTKFTSHFVKDFFFFFSFLNLSIKKGEGNSKVVKGKQNLNQVGFLNIT